jgi:hypothetical protein
MEAFTLAKRKYGIWKNRKVIIALKVIFNQKKKRKKEMLSVCELDTLLFVQMG